MIILSEAHMKAWKAQILSPSHLVRRTPVYVASFPLTHYPASKCAGLFVTGSKTIPYCRH